MAVHRVGFSQSHYGGWRWQGKLRRRGQGKVDPSRRPGSQSPEPVRREVGRGRDQSRGLAGVGWEGRGLRRAGTGAWRPFVLMFSPSGQKVSCLVGHSLSVSHRPRVVEAAADPTRGLQASPPISGPASLPHLLVRPELRLLPLRCDPRGGDPEKRRPVCWAPAGSPGVQGPTSCGPRPRSLPPGRALLGSHPPAEPDPRPGRGDARQVPGSPASAAARAPVGPSSSCQGPQPPPPEPGRSGHPVPPPGRPPGSRGNADCPAGRLEPSVASSIALSHHSRGPRGRAVAAQGCSAAPFFRPQGPFWPHRPFLHAAVLQHFRHRGGKAATIPNKTQELACDSSAWIPPAPKLSSRSFLGRSCPMFEPLLPREGDGLKAASWGLLGDQGAAGFSRRWWGLLWLVFPPKWRVVDVHWLCLDNVQFALI